MAEVKHVYLVSSGDYSDYRVICAFSTRRAARRWINAAEAHEPRLYVSDKYAIEQRELDSPPKEWMITSVRIQQDGRVTETYRKVRSGGDEDFFDIHGGLLCRVTTDDEERAIKVANERRTAVLAANLWPPVDGKWHKMPAGIG